MSSIPDHILGQASVATILLLVLFVALSLLGLWFRSNASRLSAKLTLHAARLANSPTLQRLRVRHPAAWDFVVRRFERGEYLGLHLTIGLFISIAALWLFTALTADVLHHSPITQFDLTLLEWLHAHSTPSGMTFFLLISLLGSPLVLTILGTAIAITLAVRRFWIFFAGWISALVGVGILDELLKELIRRPRPVYAFPILRGHSFSFPSGHAMASLIAYGMAVYLVSIFWVKQPNPRLAITALASILVLGIGISRLYLGVHYFSDVIAGYAAGALWLSVCITGVEMARRQPRIQA